MAWRWSGCRRVADMRCGMRVTPAPTPAAPTGVLPLRVLRFWVAFIYTPSTRILSRRSGGSERITAVCGSVTLI